MPSLSIRLMMLNEAGSEAWAEFNAAPGLTAQGIPSSQAALFAADMAASNFADLRMMATA